MRIVKGTIRKNDERIRITTRFLSFMECRMPGGSYFEQIKSDISENEPFGRILFDLFTFIAGSKVSHHLFPAWSYKKNGEYTAGDFLYHLAPVKNIKEIKQKGIVSDRNCVFLTDDIDYFVSINGYPDWKATTLKENTDFCVLKINASSLKERHKIFCIDREHEFVTEKVEPEFIVFE